MVGEGPLADEARYDAEALGLSAQVRFLGWRDDVAAIMAITDVSVLASMYEGLPYTLLEAMAAARPVVATDVAGSLEVVEEGQTGFLVPPRDAAALADRIGRLLGDDRLRREMGQAGRNRLEKHFLIEVMVRQVEAVYDDLISGKAV
jgi:glycosyltransferase involved in cell wall biosynthesis